MAAGVMRFSVILLAFAVFQTLSAASLKKLEDHETNFISSEEKDLRPELNAFDVPSESVRQARDTVVFRPLFATRQRDAQRQESRRRMDEAKRAREQRRAAQKRAAAAAAVAVHRSHAQPAPVYIYG